MRSPMHRVFKRPPAQYSPRALRGLAARFWPNVNKSGPTVRAELGPCWIWTASLDSKGYGQLGGGRRTDRPRLLRAHRVSFYLEHRRWPKPFGLHHCDVKACCNPRHIFEGSQKDNMADFSAKRKASKRA